MGVKGGKGGREGVNGWPWVSESKTPCVSVEVRERREWVRERSVEATHTDGCRCEALLGGAVGGGA